MQNYYPFVWIAFIACAFLMWFFLHRANHKERMLMIEKGLDPDSRKKDQGNTPPWKRIVGIVIGLSIGLVIISILASFKLIFGDALPLAILGICGSMGLLAGNRNSNGRGE